VTSWCHQAVVAEIPEYELLAVKQKWGALAFQAFPWLWKSDGDWTDAEHARLHAVTDAFADRSGARRSFRSTVVSDHNCFVRHRADQTEGAAFRGS
jgi:hypothetical protein